jgi:hypothetical protein
MTRAKQAARQKLFGRWRRIPDWARRLAQIGYAAKALVYLLLGAIALYDALHQRHAESGPTGMMHLLRREWPGPVLLAVLAAGMTCYGIHRCVESVLGPVRTEHWPLEVFHRIGRLGGGGTYLGLAALASDFLIRGDRSGQSQTPALAGHVMRYTLGNSLLVAIGAVLALIGIKYGYDAASRRYRRSFDLGRKGKATRIAVDAIAVFGILARSIFFLLCGALVIESGVRSDPSAARGMQGALGLIQKLPFGQWLFAVIAIGFIAYGCFCIVRAIWGSYPSDTGV